MSAMLSYGSLPESPRRESNRASRSSTAPVVHNHKELDDPASPLGATMQEVVDELLAEGPLRKIRGFARNRSRWFRLTTKYFSFYTEDGGQLIAYVPRAAICDVLDISAHRFSIKTSLTFGASGLCEMLLEARSPEVSTG